MDARRGGDKRRRSHVTSYKNKKYSPLHGGGGFLTTNFFEGGLFVSVFFLYGGFFHHVEGYLVLMCGLFWACSPYPYKENYADHVCDL